MTLIESITEPIHAFGFALAACKTLAKQQAAVTRRSPRSRGQRSNRYRGEGLTRRVRVVQTLAVGHGHRS